MQQLYRKQMDYPTIYSITEDEIDLNALVESITLSSTGAAAIFTGIVRGITNSEIAHTTIYLEYELIAAYTSIPQNCSFK